jgi:hypothetical protein
MSSNASVVGNIRAVKHLVAVVELRSICRKDGILESEVQDARGMPYEKPLYGTKTRPAQLIRDSDSNYFAFESDRNGLLLMWGTRLSLRQCLDAFNESFGRPPGAAGSSSTLGIRAVEAVAAEGDIEERSVVIRDTTFEEAQALIREEGQQVVFARIAFQGIELGWQAPHQVFEDREEVFAEINLYSEDLDLTSAKSMAMQTGDRRLFENAGAVVQIRQRGVLKTIPF